MTEDEALAKWEAAIAPLAGDPEEQHGEADGLIIEALKSLGWSRLADKWTAASEDWWWA